jgi:hypothetical protein
MKTLLTSLILGLTHASPAALVCTSVTSHNSAQLTKFGYPPKFEVKIHGAKATYEVAKSTASADGIFYDLELSGAYPSSRMPSDLELHELYSGNFELFGLGSDFIFGNCKSTGPCGEGMKYDAADGECISAGS